LSAAAAAGAGYGSRVRSMVRTQITRLPELASQERRDLNALLDEAKVGHFALQAEGHPVVIPTAIARDGDAILAHGSTGSRWMRALASGVPTALGVTLLEGIVVARSAFESSMHYRSAVVFGSCETVENATEKRVALDHITNALLPGRVAELRDPTMKELAATLVLRLAIEEWSLKISADWPEDPVSDVDGPAWAGVVPMTAVYGEPLPAPGLRAGIDVPASVRRLSQPPERSSG
jgi:nitroimidazol reductase NimA-like FMN-containing flavoprotein (pyridoxamine 5'-phosphate oxidase superfamily)